MSDQDRKNVAGVRNRKKLVLKTPCATIAEFVERYAGKVTEQGFLFSSKRSHPIGTQIHLEFQFKDGRKIIGATGEIVESEDGGDLVTSVRLTAMDPVARGLHRRLLERKNSMVAPAVAASLDRQSLEHSLRSMVLHSEDAQQPQAVQSSSELSGPVIGIDLGTTNSCCALVKKGKPFIIKSARGHNTIPSVVAVDSMGGTVVGQAAKAQMEINPQRTIYGSKRLVGRPFDSPVVRQVRDRFHYKIVAGDDNAAAVQIEDKVMSLEEVAARILIELRDTVQEHLGAEVKRAVVTVPAYYNENQRQAVRKAGELAGLHIERILNEPTSAALSYGYNRGKEQRVLVYDLGGGTFDASILNLYGNVYEVVATGGDTFLGGVDFDSQVMDYVMIEFQMELGRLPEMERVAFLRALQASEHAKCALSDSDDAVVRLPFIGEVEGQPVDLEVKVTRQRLEDLVTPLVRRTLEVCDSVLAQAKLRKEDLDAILLVGGQTRMPLVRRMLKEHFGREPHKGVHPDEAVAMGAALMAESLDKLDAVVLVDVLPVSIGSGVPGSDFIKLLPAGTQVPASKTYALKTFSANQTELHVPIYQGENAKVDENEYLGTVHVMGIPPGPPGSRTILLNLTLSPECLLTVTATDSVTGALGEVTMTTHDTPESLRQTLGLA
jgi:molecular chaperone DnaK